MGTLLASIVYLAILIVCLSLITGIRIKLRFLRRFYRPAWRIVLLAFAFYLIRGVWRSNAGGGMAIRQDQEVNLDNADFPVSIAIERNESGELIYEGFEHNLEYYIRESSSNRYNPELSHFLISICNSVGDMDWMRTSLNNMQFQTDNLISNYNMGVLPVAYCVDQKVISNDERIILVAVRGTSDDFREWGSNFNAIPDHDGRHSGFSGSADSLFDSIIKYAGKEYDLSKTIFVVTGHSRGAAVANIIAAKLANLRVPQSHIFCYCFACPDTAFLSDYDAALYKCIFTINNVNDYVSWLPWIHWKESGAYYGFSKKTHWNKYGNSYWYSTNNWQNCHTGLDNIDSVHHQMFYLNYLRQEPDFSEFRDRYESETYLE